MLLICSDNWFDREGEEEPGLMSFSICKPATDNYLEGFYLLTDLWFR